MEQEQRFDPLRAKAHQSAVGRWEDEGGAVGGWSHPPSMVAGAIGTAEEGNVRVRLIALESIALALLAAAPDHCSQLVREIASFISPRPGVTRHRLTIEAARNMTALVERADHYRRSRMRPSGRIPYLRGSRTTAIRTSRRRRRVKLEESRP